MWRYTDSPVIPASDAFKSGAWQLIDADGAVIGEFRELNVPEADHGEG